MSGIHQAVLAGAGGAPAMVTAPATVLLHMDGSDNGTTFTEVKGHSVAVTGAVTKTGTKIFGTASGLFATGNKVVVSPGSTGEFLTDADWTIEFWVNSPAQSSQGYPFAIGGADCTAYLNDTSGSLGLYLQHLGGSATTTATIIQRNTWTHIAIARQGSATRIFVDGVLDGTGTYTAGTPANSDPILELGYNGNPGNFGNSLAHYKGYLDDFRFTNGVALYTANFTPPSAAFPDV